jgi:hypothetical protein
MDQFMRLDELFDNYRKETPIVSFEETKEKFLNSVNTSQLPTKQSIKLRLSLKSWIMLAIGTSLITAFVWLLNTTSDVNELPVSNDPHSRETKIATTDTLRSSEKSEETVHQKEHPVIHEHVELVNWMDDVLNDPEKVTIEQTETPSSNAFTVDFFDEYIFPKLTDEEIKETNRFKREMLRSLQKFDKKEYAFIPTGTFPYQNDSMSVQSFYMGKKEISNKEYRTFLFDLIIQGRTDEFLIAKPDQSQWSTAKGNTAMEEHYFSHPACDNFPMVNVSRAGAELYCKWLSQELLKFVGDKHPERYNDVRLPMHVEWVFAASAEGKQLPYPWDGIYLRNYQGLILANYRAEMDPLRQDYRANITPKDMLNQGSATFQGEDLTAPVGSYFPNANGLFNMSGNVAEMVYHSTTGRNNPGTAGGGWMNTAEEIKILAPDPYNGIVGAHKNIGFRIVMTTLVNP